MNIKVTEARYTKDYCLWLKFSDGTNKEINLEDELWGEVFEPLRNQEFFRNFKLNPFTVEWENGADFAPEFLYEMEPCPSAFA